MTVTFDFSPTHDFFDHKGLVSWASRRRLDHLQFFPGDRRTPAVGQELGLFHFVVLLSIQRFNSEIREARQSSRPGLRISLGK